MTEKRKTKRVTNAQELRSSLISKTNALDLMKNSKGVFFTALFEKKDGSLRKINCQYLKDQEQSELGYVKVRELKLLKKDPEASIRNVNLQTLRILVIGGKVFKVK